MLSVMSVVVKVKVETTRIGGESTFVFKMGSITQAVKGCNRRLRLHDREDFWI